MDATLELTHERVDDVPLLLGFLIKLQLPEILDRHLPPHPAPPRTLQRLAHHRLDRLHPLPADHRKSPVQEWVDGLQHTLETLIGQPIRPVEFSDDRLTLVLKRLSDHGGLASPGSRSLALPLRRLCPAPVERVRLDATTSYGYHALTMTD